MLDYKLISDTVYHKDKKSILINIFPEVICDIITGYDFGFYTIFTETNTLLFITNENIIAALIIKKLKYIQNILLDETTIKIKEINVKGSQIILKNNYGEEYKINCVYMLTNKEFPKKFEEILRFEKIDYGRIVRTDTHLIDMHLVKEFKNGIERKNQVNFIINDRTNEICKKINHISELYSVINWENIYIANDVIFITNTLCKNNVVVVSMYDVREANLIRQVKFTCKNNEQFFFPRMCYNRTSNKLLLLNEEQNVIIITDVY